MELGTSLDDSKPFPPLMGRSVVLEQNHTEEAAKTNLDARMRDCKWKQSIWEMIIGERLQQVSHSLATHFHPSVVDSPRFPLLNINVTYEHFLTTSKIAEPIIDCRMSE